MLIENFKEDIKKHRRKIKLTCDPKIKFLKVGLAHHLLQNPKKKLDTSIFMYKDDDKNARAKNTEKLKALNITCNEPDKNAVLNEIMNMASSNKDTQKFKELRKN